MKMTFTNISKAAAVSFILIFQTKIHAQENYLIHDEVFTEQSITFNENDEISYLINSTNFDINKPTAIYFNGSLPVPLIIEWKNGSLGMIPFSYFNFSKFLERFNLILVSKPFVPVYAKESDLVNSEYVPDISQPELVDSNFMKSNNLYYLGKRGDFLVNSLVKNKVINSNRILTIGHSQGGLEAIRVASLNKYVTDVVMLASAPYGRTQHVANDFYLKYLQGEIDFKTYQKYKGEMHQYIREGKVQKDNSDKNFKESILSFEEHSFKDMMATKANILYISGTEDIAGLYADQVVIDAILNGKNNVQSKLYENAEHSFFKVESTGKVNYEIDYWEEVFDDVLEWFDGNGE